MLGVFGSLQHYLDHAVPVAYASGLHSVVTTEPRQFGSEVRLYLIARQADADSLPPGMPYVYVEHGAGQRYEQIHPSHAGAPGMAGCVGIVAPSQQVADRWRFSYPYTPTIAAGCPKLDPWHRGERPIPTDKTVAITFHWNHHITDFATWAFPYYKRELHHVVDAWRRQGWTVVGHSHPKAAHVLMPFWVNMGVEYIPTLAEVFDRAHVLVADNTSALPEFMSLGRPVIMLNSPRYSRSKSVGMRFWEWDQAGLMIDEPYALTQVDLDWLVFEDTFAAGRREVVSSVYAHTDGRASERAGNFVREIYERI
jgi:hypothetical protein